MNPDVVPQKKESFKEFIKTVLILLVIFLPIRYYVVQPFIVNGASMDPTFETGQYLIVDELTFRFSQPERGQVIIMKYPKNQDTYFIKRIIGLPGETVKISDGKVTIVNKEHPEGMMLTEEYVSSQHISHDNFSMTLTSTQYFVMGDNRAQSSDSRSWGALERDLIVGRPLIRLLPVTKIDFLPGKIQ